MPKQIRRRLLAGIYKDFPFTPHVYQDRRKVLYIGRHLCIDKRANGSITSDDAYILTMHKLDRIEDQLRIELPILFEMSDARQAVVIDLAYTMGAANLLGDSYFIDMLKARKYLDASDHILVLAWDPDIPQRAPRLAAQMAGGQWPEDIVTQFHDF